MNIYKIAIKRYRSINSITIEYKKGSPLTICGANNVGKTNFLRALDLFFSLDPAKFDRNTDVPYEIAAGRVGGGDNTTIIVYFIDDKKNKYEIQTIFKKKKDEGNVLEIKAKRNKTKLPEAEAKKIIKSFRFLLIEASNINIPKIIDEVLDEEVLPLGLDALRAKQSVPLKQLEKFIETSKKSVEKIEKDVEKNFNQFVIDIPGIDNKNWNIKIFFAEYKKLREALSGLIDFTLYDGNKRKMESKGSGIQRIVFLSLMKYISDRSKKNIIWGIDEPEAFLQPALQKRTFSVLKELAAKQKVFLTTHSQHFVDISNVENTHLFEARYEEKTFARKEGEVFYKTSTYIDEEVGEYRKIQKIKTHLGIARNDGWEIMDYNLLVEGEEDKRYILMLMEKFDLECPNFLVAGGADKIKGYLQFLNEFCEDLDFKPRILCLLDHDTKGKSEFDSLDSKVKSGFYKHFNMTVEKIPRVDGIKHTNYEYEIEDFVYPKFIIEAVNTILRKKSYAPIKITDIKKRYQVAYDQKPILKFCSEEVRASNASLPPLDLESEGIKRNICARACFLISRRPLDKLESKYPEVKKFVKRISGAV